jgi:hypothetical protein
MYNNDFQLPVNHSPEKQEFAPINYDSLAPALLERMTSQKKATEEYNRPTSGKHFSRGQGGATSQISEDYKNNRKVDHLMQKLAGYMKEGAFDDGTDQDQDL